MDVEGKGQVVLDEILARHAQVQRVPVLELSAHRLQHLLRNIAVNLVRPRKDVVPDGIGHLLSCDLADALLFAVNIPVEVMRHRVVGWVDGAVAKRLDEEFGIPGQLGAETVRSCTGPLTKPAQGAGKLMLRLRGECV